MLRIINMVNMFFFSEFQYKEKLRLVRIYFDTPTFDRITKDQSAKLVDKLSAIGGTMGLLTGFSLISGVEIVYFLIKIIFNCKQRKGAQNCWLKPTVSIYVLLITSD